MNQEPREISKIIPGNEGARDAQKMQEMIEFKINNANNFSELVDILVLLDQKKFNPTQIIEQIEKARFHLKTFNLIDTEKVLTQPEFLSSPASPVRNIPDSLGIKAKVIELLIAEKRTG